MNWNLFPIIRIKHNLLTFCSSSLPLASTKWVKSTFSSLCPLSSYQRRQWISATLKINFQQRQESSPRLLGVKQECYLCAIATQPPNLWALHHWLKRKRRKSLVYYWYVFFFISAYEEAAAVATLGTGAATRPCTTQLSTVTGETYKILKNC